MVAGQNYLTPTYQVPTNWGVTMAQSAPRTPGSPRLRSRSFIQSRNPGVKSWARNSVPARTLAGPVTVRMVQPVAIQPGTDQAVMRDSFEWYRPYRRGAL